MAEIPDIFTGGWVRNGISLDGGPFHEDAAVWWLQAPSIHADLRVPRNGAGSPTCFGGVTTWDGTALTWTRKVDLELYDGVDTGTASWDGDDLLETGTFDNPDGTSTTYVERWSRLPGSAAPLWAKARNGVYAVRAGRYALTIADSRAHGNRFRATAWTWSSNGWTAHHSLPGEPPAPSPSDIWALR